VRSITVKYWVIWRQVNRPGILLGLLNCHVTARLRHILKYNELSSIAESTTVSDHSLPVHGNLYELRHLWSTNYNYKFDIHYTGNEIQNLPIYYDNPFLFKGKKLLIYT